MPANNHNMLNLRSHRVQEIISRQPGFLEKWSLWLFLSLLALVVPATWFISYPDVINADAVLNSANGPKEIVIRQDGKLTKLLVANDSTVLQGQVIGYIESTAIHSEVITLATKLQKADSLLASNKTEKVAALFTTSFHGLGDLQTPYQQFITAWLQFDDYLVNGYYYKRKGSLANDYTFLQKMHRSLVIQQQLNQRDLDLTHETTDASDTLFRESVISKQDLRDQQSKLVAKQISAQQLTSSILNNESQQIAKQREIDELEHTIAQQKTIFQQSLETLKSDIDEWMRKYILRAPVAGKVVFIVPIQENQYMIAGRTIGFVNPSDSRYFAQVMLPQNNFGKISIGQTVKLRFDAYPYQEFGVVDGQLSYISKVPSDSGFLANIALPHGLLTTYNKEIQYRNGLKSQALIITKDQRLLQRLYYSIVKNTQQ